ncbi:MAG: chromosome segregation protein SMC, partial [Lachnospiraceae bacterium]|nr:chromosome segregation protein SMC [Lachnospiraceae bacterium]
MYLKSIEMHGFKSFANKIVLDFHNGITGIVGPNGSGKSNVADAVRWVLGEQSAKQLRGASMQDVIFAGTENRKALSYAYVAITLDNADHVLPVSFDEVTVARRVYRSGESEYLLNGTACRLRDVNELFYDTGIGKEGYSIIGQGQIEKILSGKPDERRELFDEAVGIVKFKKRKYTAEKKLSEEQENLVRVEDILGELFNRIEPLEKQATNARRFLELKERQKRLDVNLFLLDMDRLDEERKETDGKISLTRSQLDDARRLNSRLETDFDELEEKMSGINERISTLQESEKKSTQQKGNLEHEIGILKEQIRFNESSQLSSAGRIEELTNELSEKEASLADYLKERDSLQENALRLRQEIEKTREENRKARESTDRIHSRIGEIDTQVFSLMEEASSASSEEERLKTLEEQWSIRRSRLNSRLLSQKTQEDEQAQRLETLKEEHSLRLKELEACRKEYRKLQRDEEEWKRKRGAASKTVQEKEGEINRTSSRLDSIRSIAERYEGYGNAIRRVMEQKDRESGLVGVVADLIHVKQQYETAIETALGGSIQNIVTEDEDTAKRMISFLKRNHAGRATFLPITSVDGRRKNANLPSVAGEPGVIGMAIELVEFDPRYEGILSYLVGRVVVCEQIDAALLLARKNHYSLNIVTLEWEYLRPGGSLSGGAFRNSGNLLSRNRQMEELKHTIDTLTSERDAAQKRLSDIDMALALLEDDKAENAAETEKAVLAENTAKLSLSTAEEAVKKADLEKQEIREEERSLENELSSLQEKKEKNAERLLQMEEQKKQLQAEKEALSQTLADQSEAVEGAQQQMQKSEMEEAEARQRTSFVEENIHRLKSEIEKNKQVREEIRVSAKQQKADSEEKSAKILSIQATIEAAGDTIGQLQQTIRDSLAEREEMEAKKKGYFESLKDISEQITNLEKELLRLQTQKGKTEDTVTLRNNYMWEEYELTRHAAMELRDESLTDVLGMRRMLTNIRESIRAMGNVNVNAIEEYAETKERYDTMKTQHDDIVEAKEKLEEIIRELDEGMRKQFTEGFANIQREFDAAFKQLFGGGKGTLTLLPDEDVLETGIVIVA